MKQHILPTSSLLLILVISLIALASSSSSPPPPSPAEPEPEYAALHELDEDTLERALFVGRWIVLFHDPSLPRCQEALQVMRTMAFSNGIACAHVNCVEHPDVCLDYSIRTNYPIFMGSDPYLTVSRFYLKPDPDVPLTNTTLMALWRQHISGGIEELTKATFDQVFNGTWVLMPYLEHSLSTQENDGILRLLADHYNGKIHFGKIDCWEHSEVCQQYEMSTFPRTVVFHEGGIFNLQGSHTKESFKNFIFKAMNGKWSDYRDELASLREQYEESLEKRAQENEVAPGPALNEPSQRHREELEKEASGTAEDRTTAGDKKRRKRGRKSKAASAEANKPETSKLSSEELA